MDKKLYEVFIKNLVYSRGFTNRTIEEDYEKALRKSFPLESLEKISWNPRKDDCSIAYNLYHCLIENLANMYGFKDGIDACPTQYQPSMYTVFMTKINDYSTTPFSKNVVEDKIRAFLSILMVLKESHCEIKSLEDIIVNHLVIANGNKKTDNDDFVNKLYSLIKESIHKKGIDIKDINSYCNDIKEDVIGQIINTFVNNNSKGIALFGNEQEACQLFKKAFLNCEYELGDESIELVLGSYGHLKITITTFFKSMEVIDLCKELVNTLKGDA